MTAAWPVEGNGAAKVSLEWTAVDITLDGARLNVLDVGPSVIPFKIARRWFRQAEPGEHVLRVHAGFGPQRVLAELKIDLAPNERVHVKICPLVKWWSVGRKGIHIVQRGPARQR